METIKEKIKRKGVTVEHVAKMLGVDRAYLSRIINGKYQPQTDDLEKRVHQYLNALNTDDSSLVAKKE
ncbi:helix-turn-helix domain-containing protein [Fibrella forsythiae]|uniref:Helix-turn-helix transcriptional regulator n=1 Tax=Fibrella forsythiae TaxID=2817061 RepID=A0ABS3JBE9_9BACT|nr:helix-turn-helix transcriptional regulator [Fibrella forsythiae]MBO0947310.1 helix-turn-helix transcriptional regulator [Fibrella forsythiae]